MYKVSKGKVTLSLFLYISIYIGVLPFTLVNLNDIRCIWDGLVNKGFKLSIISFGCVYLLLKRTFIVVH